ncbi:MAG: hypothetical protein PVJ83_01110 [Gammaproteobacteria bacterium]|jgi:hypothetical protein
MAICSLHLKDYSLSQRRGQDHELDMSSADRVRAAGVISCRPVPLLALIHTAGERARV